MMSCGLATGRRVELNFSFFGRVSTPARLHSPFYFSWPTLRYINVYSAMELQNLALLTLWPLGLAVLDAYKKAATV